MKQVTIHPKMLSGTVTIPPSKSYSHRSLICGALSGEGTRIFNLGESQDIDATARVLSCMGYQLSKDVESEYFQKTKTTGKPLDCGESGSTLRFMIPLALHLLGKAEFIGSGRLMERPLDPYFEIFDRFGISYRMEGNRLWLNGELKSGEYHLNGSVSSQFVTGLLIALPLLSGDSEIILDTPLESAAYVDMTLAVMREFGVTVEEFSNGYRIYGNQQYQPNRYTVEGDYSQAAFFLVGAALGGDITCEGIPQDTLQGDRAICSILEQAGAKIVWNNGKVNVYSERLSGFCADVSECPDLAPILAVLGAFSKGESRIINAGRLRYKESDRLAAITKEMTALGADIQEGTDYLVIRGKESIRGGVADAHNDHRIAMSLAIAAQRCEQPVTILGSECVAKSMPDFWERFCQLGGSIDECSMGE